MGYLYCKTISKIFIDYLKNIGPITIAETVQKYDEAYDQMIQKEYREELEDPELDDEYKSRLGKRDEDWIEQTLMACELSVLHYLPKGLIEPANRRGLIPIVQLWSSINITAENEKRLFVESSSVEEVNKVICEAAARIDESGPWLDQIAWKMSAVAVKRPALLKPFDGVDL